MSKIKFITKERVLDLVNCNNVEILEHIKGIHERASKLNEDGVRDIKKKAVTWDYKKHVQGWQINQAEQINENVPISYIRGEMMYQSPADYREPNPENGDLIEIADADGNIRAFMFLDFEWIPPQKVHFQAIGVAVNLTDRDQDKEEPGARPVDQGPGND